METLGRVRKSKTKEPEAVAVPGAKRDGQLQAYKPQEPLSHPQRLCEAELRTN